MSIGKRIAANRAARERGSVDVVEWGENDAPLTIYFTNVSARDIEKVRSKHNDFLTNPSLTAMVDIIILKSENADGEKMFTLEDKVHLMGEPIDIIAEVFGSVFSSNSAEELEKN
jgi:hypothetical protein